MSHLSPGLGVHQRDPRLDPHLEFQASPQWGAGSQKSLVACAVYGSGLCGWVLGREPVDLGIYHYMMTAPGEDQQKVPKPPWHQQGDSGWPGEGEDLGGGALSLP